MFMKSVFKRMFLQGGIYKYKFSTTISNLTCLKLVSRVNLLGLNCSLKLKLRIDHTCVSSKAKKLHLSGIMLQVKFLLLDPA